MLMNYLINIIKRIFHFDQFKNIISSHFNGHGFLVDDNSYKQKKSYINLKIMLFPSKTCSAISNYLEFMFKKGIFSFFIVVLAIVVTYTIYIYHFNIDNKYQVIKIFYTFLIFNVSLLIHEFGHISAYNYFIKKEGLNRHYTSGQIGFGFYFIFPVYYSNVNQTWSLDKKSRLIINIAGIYFQIVFVLILILSAKLFSVNWFYIPAYSIILHSLFSLNPFIRNDGYWILSDLTGSYNLLQNSKTELRKFLQNKKFKNINWKTFYSLGNYILFILFTTYIILVAKLELFYFPINFIKSVYYLLTYNLGKIEFNSYWIYYLGFYLIIIKVIRNIIKRIINS